MVLPIVFCTKIYRWNDEKRFRNVGNENNSKPNENLSLNDLKSVTVPSVYLTCKKKPLYIKLYVNNNL